MSSKIWVQIVGSHPHSSEQGCILVVDEKVEVHMMDGNKLYRVELINCRHGNEACFANVKNLRKGTDPEDVAPRSGTPRGRRG